MKKEQCKPIHKVINLSRRRESFQLECKKQMHNNYFDVFFDVMNYGNQIYKGSTTWRQVYDTKLWHHHWCRSI